MKPPALPLAFLLLLPAALLLSACVTTPERRAPDWVLAPPEATSSTEYFVGAGSDAGGNEVVAERAAADEIIAEIVRYIGVRVAAETVTEVEASLDAFEGRVSRSILQQSDARLEGLRVEDRYVDRREEVVLVYLLVEYDRAALEAERERVQELIRERREAVQRPLREARSQEEAGRYFVAVESYLRAAEAAAESQIENAELLRREALRAARSLVESFELRPVSGPEEAVLGRGMEQAFVARLTARSAEGSPQPIAAAEVAVAYRAARGSRDPSTQTGRVVSNAEGLAIFSHPEPGFVGEAMVSMYLDFESWFAELRRVGDGLAEEVAGLERIVAEKRATFRFEVVTPFRGVPMAVSIVETDIVGNPLESRDADQGTQQALAEAELDVRIVNLEAALIASGSIEAISARIREVYPEVEYALIGMVRIEEFNEDDGILVRVGGNMSVLELDTGRTLISESTIARSVGNNAASVISASFRRIGRAFGESLVRGLR